MRRLILTLAWSLILTLPIGCSGSSRDPAQGPSDTGQSGVGPAENETDPVIIDPKEFEQIALATDTSYEVPAISQGTSPGEVREFTAMKIPFSWCPPGTFVMGSSRDAPGHHLNESQFEVTISRGFWMQKTELTQSQYETLMGVNPSHFDGQSHPVETVSWNEAMEFCRRLSALPPEKESGNLYRLPTEAEWEYACRAGATTIFSFGDEESGIEAYGWINVNSQRTTHPVATREPNAWNLYDMHGNVLEWCSDWYADYPAGPVTDPRGPESGEKRCLRGGGWFFVPEVARCSHRDAYIPTARYIGLGFRLVAEVTTQD